MGTRHVLRIYVDSHCDVCRESRRLARVIGRLLPWLTVELVNIDEQKPVDEMFAVPTFCYRGRILSLGNPTEDDLCGRIMAIDRELGAGVPAMNARGEVSREEAREKRGRLATCCGTAGIGLAVLCSLGLFASTLGLFTLHGPSAASSARDPSWLLALLHLGRVLVVTSTLLVVTAVLLRGGKAVLLAVAGGVVLYGGMYGQSNAAVMDGAMILGIAALGIANARSLRLPAVRLAMTRPR